MTRNVSDVINEALLKNRRWEYILFSFACLSLIMGAILIVWSIIRTSPILALLGALESALMWPASTAIQQIRKDSVMLRLLEFPLSRSRTSAEAAEMLQHLIVEMTSSRGTKLRVSINPSSEESIKDFLDKTESYVRQEKSQAFA